MRRLLAASALIACLFMPAVFTACNKLDYISVSNRNLTPAHGDESYKDISLDQIYEANRIGNLLKEHYSISVTGTWTDYLERDLMYFSDGSREELFYGNAHCGRNADGTGLLGIAVSMSYLENSAENVLVKSTAVVDRKDTVFKEGTHLVVCSTAVGDLPPDYRRYLGLKDDDEVLEQLVTYTVDAESFQMQKYNLDVRYSDDQTVSLELDIHYDVERPAYVSAFVDEFGDPGHLKTTAFIMDPGTEHETKYSVTTLKNASVMPEYEFTGIGHLKTYKDPLGTEECDLEKAPPDQGFTVYVFTDGR